MRVIDNKTRRHAVNYTNRAPLLHSRKSLSYIYFHCISFVHILSKFVQYRSFGLYFPFLSGFYTLFNMVSHKMKFTVEKLVENDQVTVIIMCMYLSDQLKTTVYNMNHYRIYALIYDLQH